MNQTSRPTFWIVAALVSAIGLVIAFILFCFDPASSGFYPICLFHQTTGLMCPGCGSLRALHQLLHGNLAAAFRFNPILVLSLPLLAGYGLLGVTRTHRDQPLNLFCSVKWLWVFLVLALAFTVWRNIPGTMFASLPR